MTGPTVRTTRVQTYYGRRGRLRTRRREALSRLLPVHGVSVYGPPLDRAELFGREAPLVLEIGSGMGDATVAAAAADPDRDYLAAEVHAAGVAATLLLIEERGLRNLRVAHGDALELLEQRIPPDSLAEIRAYFPDPWPKARHHKRRLIQPAHVALMRSRLVPGGIVHTVTDWDDYAQVMLETLTGDPELVNVHPPGEAPRQPHRPVTKYEQKAVAAGRAIHEFVFRRAVASAGREEVR